MGNFGTGSGLGPVDPHPAAPPIKTLHDYTNPTGSSYPVIAFNNVQLSDSASEDEVKTLLEGISECGFNANIWVTYNAFVENLENVRPKYLDVADSLRLPTVLFIGNNMPTFKAGEEGQISYLASLLETLYKQSKRKSLWGYLIADEPGYALWQKKEPCKDETDNAKRAEVDLYNGYKTYLANAWGKVGYINLAVAFDDAHVGAKLAGLIPSDSSLEVIGSKRKEVYQEYLKEFRIAINPVMMSIDIYPIYKFVSRNVVENPGKPYKGDDSDYSAYTLKSEYYYTLELISRFSRDNKVPFWMYMLANKHLVRNSDGDTYRYAEYPRPTKGTLRFQAFNAIAFGFKGLVFWSYGKKPDDPYKEYCLNSLYDDNELWRICREVIPEIKGYGEVLLDATFDKAVHVLGEMNGSIPCVTPYGGMFGCIDNATTVGSGKGFVMTHLTKKDGDITRKYVAIVSHDPFYSQTIELTFISSVYQCKDVTNHNDGIQDIIPFAPFEGKCRFTLVPGGMLLIEYRPYSEVPSR